MADITAARLNNLQSRIELILGTGSGTNGYGQAISSSQVNNTQVVDADHINNIYADMIKARIHQVGVTETGIREVIEDLNTIAEDTSQQVSSTGATAADAEGAKKGIADYESLMTQIETDKFNLHPSQAVLEPKLTSTRTATWNGLIFHIFTVTFNDADQRRHYFNTGGQIRLSANNTGAGTPKGLDWAALTSEIGTITFSAESTLTSGLGQGYYIGNNSLSSAYQTVFSRVGSGSYSNIYAGNLYTIKCRETDTRTIEFRIEFNDVVVDNNIDNNVDGTLTSTVQQYRAVGASSVTATTPTYFTSTQLSGFNVPIDNTTPTYTLSGPAGSINESTNFTITLTTTNVANGTSVPYTITGVTSADISNASLTGNLVMQNNSASLSYTMAQDSLTEGQENLTFALNNGLSSITIEVQDTSILNIAYNLDPQWYNEFSASWLDNIPKSSAVTMGAGIAQYLYDTQSGAYTNTAGATRYALNRRPDAAGLAYWTREWNNSYRQEPASGDVSQDAGWNQFTKVFFNAADQSTNPIVFTVNGAALTGSGNSDSARALLASKPRIAGDGVGFFGDRGITGGDAGGAAPGSSDFAFTVTPATGINFNHPLSYGTVTATYTISCTAGTGSVTIQEQTRPSVIPVGIDDSYSPGFSGQTTVPTAQKTYQFFSSGETRQVEIKINNGATGTYQGSFAFFESTGTGQSFTRGWGGTFT